MTTSRFSRLFIAFLTLVSLLSVSTSVWAQSSPSEKSSEMPEASDDWFAVTLQGKKCGYMHATQSTHGDKVETKSLTLIEIARGGAKLKISMEQNYLESQTGTPLSFSSKVAMGTIPVVYSGKIKDGKIELLTEQSGVTKKDSYPFDPEVKFAWGQMLEQRKRGLKPGTRFRVKTYEPSVKPDAAVEVEMNVQGKELVNVLGKKRNLNRITSTLQLPMPVTSEMFVDDEARAVVMTVDLGILQMKMYETSKEDALKGGAPPEMFLDTLVHVREHIGNGAKEVQLKLSIKADEGPKFPKIPNTAAQTFKRISDNEGLLTIRRLDWDKIRAVRDTDYGPKLHNYLRASTICDIDDKRIKRLARQAIKNATTPAEKADALRKFVSKYITDKNMNVGFATASEVAQNRSGDCTEHGVLLAAIARAAGLPARGVSGLVEAPPGAFAPAKGSAFGYHMWTQVYIGDQWVDIDAAMNETDCEPNHIALSLMPLNEEGMLDSVSALMPLIGRLKIEVVGVKR